MTDTANSGNPTKRNFSLKQHIESLRRQLAEAEQSLLGNAPEFQPQGAVEGIADTPGRMETAPHGEAEGIRVMLVDDHAVLRQGLARLLREEPGIEIVGEASDGESAVSLARRVRPEVILMDISMPGMSGIEATRIIHADLPDTRIIGLSMFEEASVKTSIRDAGAIAYLSKTGPADELFQAIRDRLPPRAELSETAADSNLKRKDATVA